MSQKQIVAGGSGVGGQVGPLSTYDIQTTISTEWLLNLILVGRVWAVQIFASSGPWG